MFRQLFIFVAQYAINLRDVVSDDLCTPVLVRLSWAPRTYLLERVTKRSVTDIMEQRGKERNTFAVPVAILSLPCDHIG